MGEGRGGEEGGGRGRWKGGDVMGRNDREEGRGRE